MDIAALRNELLTDPADLGYAALVEAQDYPALAALVNERTLTSLPNPAPQTQTPRRLTLNDLLAEVTAAEALAVMSLPNLPERIERAAALNDRTTLATLLGLLAGAGAISPASGQNVSLLLAQTEPDPTWTASIEQTSPSRADVLGLGRVTEHDVQAALT